MKSHFPVQHEPALKKHTSNPIDRSPHEPVTDKIHPISAACPTPLSRSPGKQVQTDGSGTRRATPWVGSAARVSRWNLERPSPPRTWSGAGCSAPIPASTPSASSSPSAPAASPSCTTIKSSSIPRVRRHQRIRVGGQALACERRVARFIRARSRVVADVFCRLRRTCRPGARRSTAPDLSRR